MRLLSSSFLFIFFLSLLRFSFITSNHDYFFHFYYVLCSVFFCFFFKQKPAYEMRISDWSSDVCSSDLTHGKTLYPCSGYRAWRTRQGCAHRLVPCRPGRPRAHRPGDNQSRRPLRRLSAGCGRSAKRGVRTGISRRRLFRRPRRAARRAALRRPDHAAVRRGAPRRKLSRASAGHALDLVHVSRQLTPFSFPLPAPRIKRLSMEAFVLEYGNLLLRWLHVIAAIAWIGESVYFVMLDNSLHPPRGAERKKRGVFGERWAVHGDGFYQNQKSRPKPAELTEVGQASCR